MLRSSINRSMQQINRNLSEIKCKRLEGKVAIVTASTQGIGFAIAKRLAEEGAKVMISSRKEENVQNALKELKSKNLNVCGMTCHVGKNEDRKSLLEKTIQEFHGLDILVLNAGVNPSFSTFFETSESVWDKIFDINVKSTFLLLRDSLSFLRKSKSASVILLSSIVGYLPLDVSSYI
uniref:Dehydrogenase/reductase SDR family member 4 n=1 Tax=Apis cerana TaxID=7461 RepID=V9IES0_APICE